MKRMQLFEIEDFRWFPDFFRNCMTDFLVAMHRLARTKTLIAPMVARLLRTSPAPRVVDLCSGGGGPMEEVLPLLQQLEDPSVSIVMTDLYPNARAAERVNGQQIPQLQYRTAPVDATQVPQDLTGVRTMVCSFHHMNPAMASNILTDAFKKRQPLMIFEISDNSFPWYLWWLALPANFLMALFLMPYVRPFTWRHFVFTYLIPVLPLAIAWDGAASNARTYTQDDLKELIEPHQAQDYRWEIGTKTGRMPGKMLYLLGIPSKA